MANSSAGPFDYLQKDANRKMHNAFDPFATAKAKRRKMLEAEAARLDFLKKIQRSDRQRQEVLSNPATEAMAAAMGVPGRSSSTRMSDAQMRKIIEEQSPKYGLMAGLKTGENIAKQTNRYQPSTGLRRLGEIFGGMGTTPGASFASDLIGSGQRLSARDEAGALRNRAEQAAQQKAALDAKRLEIAMGYKQREEARDIKALGIQQATEKLAKDKYFSGLGDSKAAIDESNKTVEELINAGGGHAEALKKRTGAWGASKDLISSLATLYRRIQKDALSANKNLSPDEVLEIAIQNLTGIAAAASGQTTGNPSVPPVSVRAVREK